MQAIGIQEFRFFGPAFLAYVLAAQVETFADYFSAQLAAAKAEPGSQAESAKA